MPVHNAGSWLGSSIVDILGQEDVSTRLWLIDDQSNDGAVGDSLSHLSDDQRQQVHVITMERRSGVARALEAGRTAAMNAGARLIGRMDADDRCQPDRFRALIRALLEHPNWSAVGSQVEGFPNNRVTPAMSRYLRWMNAIDDPSEIRNAQFLETPLLHATCLFRADALEEVGGWRPTAWSEDTDLWCRFHQHGKVAAKVKRILYQWRQHPDQETRRSATCSREQLVLGRAHHLCSWLRTNHQGHLQLVGTGKSLSLWHQSIVKIDCGIPIRVIEWNARVARSQHQEQAPQLQREGVAVFVAGSHSVRNQVRRLLPSWAMDEGKRLWFVA